MDIKELDVIEILHITGDDTYKVYSYLDERIYTMTETDIKHEESRGSEIIGEL